MNMVPIQPFNKHKKFHFGNEQDMHRVSKNYKEINNIPQFEFANHLELIVCVS